MIKRFDGEHAFLSNFFPMPNGTTVEHLYQAAKAKNREDAEKILTTETPGQAKRLGRCIEIREDWEEIKVDVMRLALDIKFEVGSELAKKLLATGNQILVEGNTWNDRFWGQCPLGYGQNHLGRLLMERRSVLRSIVEQK